MSEKFTTGELRSFFAAFEADTDADPETLARRYAPAIIVAGPSGSQVVPAADLVRGIAKRQQLFAAAGRRSTALVGLDETRLDARYTLARTEWRWQFSRPDAETVDLTLPSTFIVDRAGEPRIVFYLAHADVTAVLRERGLVTGS